MPDKQPFLEFRKLLPKSARQKIPLRPRLLDETAEGMIGQASSYWLVIVPEEGPAELCNYTDPERLARRIKHLLDIRFDGNLYMFYGRRVLLSDPPQPYLVFGDGRLVPIEPLPEMLRINPDGRLDPEAWEKRMRQAMRYRSGRGDRNLVGPSGDYTDEEYEAAEAEAGDAYVPVGDEEESNNDIDDEASLPGETAEIPDDLP